MPEVDHIERTALEGGLRVVTERMPGVRSVAVGAWVGVGNRDEPASISGASHFLEHLLFKGTPTRSAREIAETVDATGGDLNAYTTKEYTAFYGRLPARHLSLGLDLLMDVVARPAFRPLEVESERKVILEELHLQLDDPDDLVHTALYEGLFPQHPLGWEVLGTIDTVSRVQPGDLHGFHDRWYRPANLVVAAAGDVDHDRVVDATLAAFGDVDPGERPCRKPPAEPPERCKVVRRRTEQVHVAVGWRALPHGDPDRYALAIANQILGGGLSSRLFQSIREEHGLAYSVYSGVSAFVDSGVLSIYAGTAPERLGELARAMGGELRRLVDEGVSEREVAVARDGVEGSTVLSLEDPGSRMSRLGASETVLGRVVPVDEYLAAVAAVTPEDVVRVVRRVMAGSPTVALVGPVPRSRSAVDDVVAAVSAA